MSDTLVVNEIYLSLQGESTFAGLPCIFVRLTACDLRCSYCDTAYAFTEGKKKSLAKILAKVRELAEPFSSLSNHSDAQRLPTSPGRTDRRRTAAPEKFPAADEIALRRRFHRLVGNQRRARYFPGGPARPPHHGFEMPGQRRSGTQPLGKSHTFEGHRRNQVRHRHARRITSGQSSRSPRTSSTAICPLLFSWVHPLAPEQQNKIVEKSSRRDRRRFRGANWRKKSSPTRCRCGFRSQLHKIIWPPEQRGV